LLLFAHSVITDFYLLSLHDALPILMLTVAYGLTSVPSPLKLIPSTMAFGCAIPPTMFHPCAVNTHEPCRVYSPQPSARPSASAALDVPSAIAATRLTSAHANSEQLVIILTSFVFIVIVSFHSCFLVLAFFGYSS